MSRYNVDEFFIDEVLESHAQAVQDHLSKSKKERKKDRKNQEKEHKVRSEDKALSKMFKRASTGSHDFDKSNTFNVEI